MFVREAQLLLRADHARRFDAADLRRLENGGLPAPSIDQAGAGPCERELLAAEANATTTSGVHPPPEQAAEVRDAAGQLLRLAPRERAAVLLKDVFDLSLAATASVLKPTVGTVKTALHRGRGRLCVPAQTEQKRPCIPSRGGEDDNIGGVHHL